MESSFRHHLPAVRVPPHATAKLNVIHLTTLIVVTPHGNALIMYRTLNVKQLGRMCLRAPKKRMRQIGRRLRIRSSGHPRLS